ESWPMLLPANAPPKHPPFHLAAGQLPPRASNKAAAFAYRDGRRTVAAKAIRPRRAYAAHSGPLGLRDCSIGRDRRGGGRRGKPKAAAKQQSARRAELRKQPGWGPTRGRLRGSARQASVFSLPLPAMPYAAFR